MGEFNYKKFLTENKLTYASREVASSNLNEDLNKSDFEVGLTILNEIGYNINEDLLTEIKLKDFMTKVGSSIKNSVKALASDKSPSKNNKKDFTKKLALLKKLSPSEEVYNEFIELLKSGKKATVSDLTKLATSSSKEPIEELAKMSGGIKKIMAWVGLSIYLLAFANNLNYTPEQINVANQTTTTIDVGDNYTPTLGAVGDTVAKGLDGEREDLSKEDGKKLQKDLEKIGADVGGGNITDQTVTSDGIDINFDTGQWEADTDKAAEQGAAEIIKNNPNLKSATLKYSSDISNTPGAQDDNPDGPDKTGLGEKRLDTAKEIALKIQKILQDKYPDAQIDIEDGGTNVSDVESQGEVDSGSDEAKSQQKSSVKLTDVQDGDKTPEPTPEDPTPDSDVKPMTPKEVIAFYSEKPDFDSSKYLVIAFQLLPRIIGNGKVINNPEFERFAKHLTIAKKGETFNDKFIARRIDGEEGSLVKKAAKSKGTEKEEILDTIDTLRWIRNTKKSPSNIEKWIKRLDPDIKLGERGVFKHRWSKDITNQGEPGVGDVNKGAGRTAAPNDGKGITTPKVMMESQSIYNEWISLLLEFNIAGYDESSAKNNLGLLTQLYSGIWPRKDGSYIEYDNEYLEDKYKSSVDKFEKTFPTIGKKMAQYAKDQKDKKVDPKQDPTTSPPGQDKTPTGEPGEKVKATKIEPKKGDAEPGKKVDTTYTMFEPGEKVKATKIEPGKRSSSAEPFFGTVDNPSGKQKPKAGDKEKSTTPPVDFDAKDKSKTPQSAKALEKMGAKKDLTTALSRIDNRPELEGLIKSMITYITIDNDDKILALKTAKTRFTPLEDQPKYTSTSTDGAKINYNLKEQITRLIGLISEAEEKQRPDVEKSIKILDKYADLKALLGRLSNKEMAIEFILGVMKFVGDNLKAKSSDIKTSLSNITRDLEKEKDTPSNKLDKKGIENIKNQPTTETLIRRKIRSLIKEQVRNIFKEETVENPKPGELIPAKAKSAGKDALILTRPDGAPYAVAHPDITSLSKMFLNGKQDDAALCGWVQKKIKEPDFIEDLMESNLSLNEASEIDPKTIKPLNNCPLK